MTRQSTRARNAGIFALLTSTLLLAACGDESTDGTSGQDATATASELDTQNPTGTPTISGAPTVAAAAGTSWTFQPQAQDPDGDPLAFSVQGLPSWAEFDPSTGRITGTPAAADAGVTADIILAVTDGRRSAELAPFRVSIAAAAAAAPSVPGNAAPTISGQAAGSITAGTAYSFTPAASDPDTLALTFAITNKPAWASFSAATGRLTGTPSARQVGIYRDIVIVASDGRAQAALPAFSIEVKAAPNAAPTLTGAPATSVRAGSAYSFAPAASDPEKQPLGFSIANKPAWASFNTATGALTGTPSASHVGTSSGIVISVTDGVTQVALPAFAVTVQAAANGAPSISGTPSQAARAGAAWSFTPTASDPDGGTLSFTVAAKPAWASFDAATGRLSGTPGSGDIGTFSNIQISVSDGQNTVSLPTFGIVVSGSTVGSATLSWTPPTQNTDGSQLTNLAGYRIYYGASAGSLSNQVQVNNAGLTSYTVGNLGPGTHYFSIAAVTADGVEGVASAVGSKTIL